MGLFTVKCSSCGDRVRRGAKFCPHCGAGTAPASIACSSCGASMGATAKFCPRCGTAAANAPNVVNQRWRRSAQDFAVRIDVAAQASSDPFVVEHGTRALIFHNGVFKGEVPAGRYDRAGFFKSAGEFPIDSGTVVVLMDAGDVTLDLENGGLRSSDGFELGMRARLVIRVTEPETMFVNLMKGSSVVRVSDPAGTDDLESQLSAESQIVLRSEAAAHPADELFGNADIRSRFESRLREALAGTLSRLGLELVQLRFLDFEGERYAELRRSQAESGIARKEGEAEIEQARTRQGLAESGAELAADRVRLNARLRQILTQEKMDGFKSAAELEQFIRQTEHSLGLQGVVRADEMQRLQERLAFERDREGVLRRIEIAGIVLAGQREQALEQLQAEERQRDVRLSGELRRRLEATQSEVDRRKIEIELQQLEHAEQMRRGEAEEQFKQKKAQAALDMLKQVKDLEAAEDLREQELEEKKLAARSQASVAALISVVDGDAREVLLKLEQKRIEGAMSPEQMLAEAAKTSPEAAKALAQKFQADGLITAKAAEERAALLERQIADQRQMSEGYADRMERLMQTAMDRMGDVAATRAQAAPANTIVTPGVPGAHPVVVHSPASAAKCRFCGAAMEAGAAFCAECGKKQQ